MDGNLITSRFIYDLPEFLLAIVKMMNSLGNGAKLAYVLAKPGEPEVLAITSLNGAETRTILAADAVYPFLGKPSWSFDGTTIAVPRSRGGNARDIWLVPANGGTATRFTQSFAVRQSITTAL